MISVMVLVILILTSDFSVKVGSDELLNFGKKCGKPFSFFEVGNWRQLSPLTHVELTSPFFNYITYEAFARVAMGSTFYTSTNIHSKT